MITLDIAFLLIILDRHNIMHLYSEIYTYHTFPLIIKILKFGIYSIPNIDIYLIYIYLQKVSAVL